LVNRYQRRKYTKTPAGTVARVRPHRTIVRGGSRVTRGKRSVFPKRVYAPSKSSFHVTSQFKYFVSQTTILVVESVIANVSDGTSSRSPSPISIPIFKKISL